MPPAGRLLVTAGRIGLVELTAAELAELADLGGTADAHLWAPGEPAPRGLPELTEGECSFVQAAGVSARAATAPHPRARHLDGADWDDPAATPPDPPAR